jgi:hypothetical protein
MKRAEIVVTAFVIILGFVLDATPAQPPSHPLRVRGGGKLRLSSQATQTASLVKLIVQFEAGTVQQAADYAPAKHRG